MAINYIEQPLPKVEKLPFSVNAWRGLNKIKGAENSGEMVYMKNMSSDNAPFSSPRKSREIVADGIENPQNLFAAGDKIGYIAGGKLYYDGSVVKDEDDNDALVGETSAIVDFNGNVVMYPSNVVYDYIGHKATILMHPEPLGKIQGFYDAQTGEHFDTGGKDKLDIYHPPYSANCYAAVFCLGEIETPDNETVVINASGLTSLEQGVGRSLVIVAFDGDDNVITYYPAGSNEKYFRTSLGVPIKIKNAARLKVMVGYYEGTYARKAPRNTDFESAEFWYTQVSDYVAVSDVPVIRYACVDNNRIFAADGNNIYASSQGKYDEWTRFADDDGNPDPLGSYAEKLDTPQDITGIVKYRGNVVITKPDLVYEAYGNRPPYRINEIAKTGCIDGRSIVEVNSVLYWLGRKGVYAYTGGQPEIISEKLGKTFENGVAGTDGRKYYISAFDGDEWELYVYDTFTGLWHVEDDLECVGFAYAQGYMHALSKDGKLYKFNSGGERVKWEFETQEFTFGIPNTKTLSKIYVRVQMESNTYLDIYIKKDNGEFEKKASYHANDYTMFDFKAKVKKFDSFAIKFSGIGDVRILDVHGDVIVGTAKHKNGDLSVFRG